MNPAAKATLGFDFLKPLGATLGGLRDIVAAGMNPAAKATPGWDRGRDEHGRQSNAS